MDEALAVVERAASLLPASVIASEDCQSLLTQQWATAKQGCSDNEHSSRSVAMVTLRTSSHSHTHSITLSHSQVFDGYSAVSRGH